MAPVTSTKPRAVRDVYGRHYRVGEQPEHLIGHSRRWQVWAAWACLVAISPLQYSFGLAALGLAGSRGWSPIQTMWLLAVFVTCQAGVAMPAAWMHRDKLASPSQLIVAGGVMSAVAFAVLAHADALPVAVLGYAVVGGIGAGLVYSTCITTAAKWFPDHRVSTIGFVTGGFACGAVPSIVAFTAFSSAVGQVAVFDTLAVVALVTVTVAGLQLKDPPAHWWPSDLDPQAWAVDRRLNRSIPHNRPAVRYYAPGEALRTGALPLMWLMLAMITAVSLLGIAYVAGYAVASGLGTVVAAIALGLLAAVNGLGRSLAGRLSDWLGRRRVLAAVLLTEGIAHLGLAVAGQVGSSAAFVVCAMFAGLGGGAFYAIFANLVLEYFGENSLLQNQSVLYSAKAVGGLVGVGGAALLVAEIGYGPVFVAAGVLGVLSAVMARFLRQPGSPSLSSHSQLGTPVLGRDTPAR